MATANAGKEPPRELTGVKNISCPQKDHRISVRQVPFGGMPRPDSGPKHFF